MKICMDLCKNITNLNWRLKTSIPYETACNYDAKYGYDIEYDYDSTMLSTTSILDYKYDSKYKYPDAEYEYDFSKLAYTLHR